MNLTPIGIVHSPLTNPSDAPRQGREGAPSAWLEIYPQYTEGLLGIRPGSELILITWLHLAERDRLQTHPRGDRSQPLTGVFSNRSPHRPNPLGLHRVRVLAVDPAITRLRDGAGRLDPRQEHSGAGADCAHGCRLHVEPLEAVDGTPILDLKSVMSGVVDW